MRNDVGAQWRATALNSRTLASAFEIMASMDTAMFQCMQSAESKERRFVLARWLRPTRRWRWSLQVLVGMLAVLTCGMLGGIMETKRLRAITPSALSSTSFEYIRQQGRDAIEEGANTLSSLRDSVWISGGASHGDNVGVSEEDGTLAGDYQPIALVGIPMLDSPVTLFRRKLLRTLYKPFGIRVTFIIQDPIPKTLEEPDVIATNHNVSHTGLVDRLWFEHAHRVAPDSVQAVFKVKEDAMPCPGSIKSRIRFNEKFPFVYYGDYRNRGNCDALKQDAECPRTHCWWNNTFIGDCNYYMDHRFYGFSRATLGEIVQTPIFAQEPTRNTDGGVLSGLWVNQTDSRGLVHEAKVLAGSIPTSVQKKDFPYQYHVTVMIESLSSQHCVEELKHIVRHLEDIYRDTPWKNEPKN